MPMQCWIIHTIAGRTRLRVPALKHQEDLASTLTVYLQDQPGITAVHTTPVCESVRVTYEPARWSPEALCRLIAGLSPAQLRTYQPTAMLRKAAPLQPADKPWFELLLSSVAVAAS